jgi:hypothetical protein
LRASQWRFAASILVLGLITGLVAVRQPILTATADFTDAERTLEQSRNFDGQVNLKAPGGGAGFADHPTAIGMASTAAVGGFDTGNPCD